MNEYFGGSVASAGDINGDGFADTIIGASGQSHPEAHEGNTFVYYGSRAGLPSTHDLRLDNPDNQAGGYFGNSVASAGDVNGDGFDDVIVGACYQDNGSRDEGNAFVYYGSRDGLLSDPFLRLDNPDEEAEGDFGWSVASAGDVNGDGFDDVIVGATGQDRGATNEGNAFVYYGAATGLDDGHPLTLDNPANQVWGEFGCSVAWADEGGREERLDLTVVGLLRRLLPGMG